MKKHLVPLIAPFIVFVAIIAFKIGNDYFVASQYTLNSDAAMFRDDCAVATVDRPAPKRRTEYLSFLFSPVMRAAMHRMCSCAADEIQSKYPDRTDMIQRVFNTGISRRSQEKRLSEMHQIIAEYSTTEDQMIAIFDDIGRTIKGCTQQQS